MAHQLFDRQAQEQQQYQLPTRQDVDQVAAVTSLEDRSISIADDDDDGGCGDGIENGKSFISSSAERLPTSPIKSNTNIIAERGIDNLFAPPSAHQYHTDYTSRSPNTSASLFRPFSPPLEHLAGNASDGDSDIDSEVRVRFVGHLF